MSRKYRQAGYQDNERGERKGRSKGPRPTREGPRSPRMMGFQEVMRCSMCGTTLPRGLTDIQKDSTCPKCDADLHTCRACVFFDSAARFECTQPVSARVAPKDKRNNCRFFEARTRVEKQTSLSSEPKPSLDPRDAFERLFKK